MGRYHVLVRDYFNGANSFNVSVRPEIYFRDRVNDRTLVVEDKSGRQLHLFATAGLLPTPVPLFAPIQGNLLLDLTVFIYLGPQPVPASGTLNWPLNFQPYPVALQGLTIQAAPLDARMTQAVN